LALKGEFKLEITIYKTSFVFQHDEGLAECTDKEWRRIRDIADDKNRFIGVGLAWLNGLRWERRGWWWVRRSGCWASAVRYGDATSYANDKDQQENRRKSSSRKHNLTPYKLNFSPRIF
jgi:hypothetical protein